MGDIMPSRATGYWLRKIIKAISERLPLSSNNNLNVNIAEDSVGLATETTLQAVRDRLPSSLTTSGNLRVSVEEDNIGLAKDVTVGRLTGALESIGSDKLRTKPDNPPALDVNLSVIRNILIELQDCLVPRMIFEGILVDVDADHDIFEPIEVEREAVLWRIYIVPTKFSSPPRLYVVRHTPRADVVEFLNNGEPLDNDRAYMFDIMARRESTITLRVDQPGVIAYLLITEYCCAPG